MTLVLSHFHRTTYATDCLGDMATLPEFFCTEAVGVYSLARDATQRLATHRRRRETCRQAETEDIAQLPSARPQITARNSRESHVLRLPLELRLQIYDDIPSEPVTINMRESHERGSIEAVTYAWTYCSCASSGCCSHSPCLPLIRCNNIMALPTTCRQMYAETIARNYRYNTIRFAHYPFVLSIPEILPAKHLRSITKIGLHFNVDPLIENFRRGIILEGAHTDPISGDMRSPLPAKRREQYINLWKILATDLLNLQDLRVTFKRQTWTDDSLEQRICEWFLGPLLLLSEGSYERSKAIAHFKVQLAFAWRGEEFVSVVHTLLAAKSTGQVVPFTLTSEYAACLHDISRWNPLVSI